MAAKMTYEQRSLVQAGFIYCEASELAALRHRVYGPAKTDDNTLTEQQLIDREKIHAWLKDLYASILYRRDGNVESVLARIKSCHDFELKVLAHLKDGTQARKEHTYARASYAIAYTALAQAFNLPLIDIATGEYPAKIEKRS